MPELIERPRAAIPTLAPGIIPITRQEPNEKVGRLFPQWVDFFPAGVASRKEWPQRE